MIPQEIDCNDPKYKYLFTVDTINTLVENGVSFRDAYRQIGKQVQEGTYEPDTSKKHTHIGSIDNLRSEEHTSELQSRGHLVCRLLLEKKECVRWICTGA